MRRITLLLLSVLSLASCTSVRYTGVSRIRDYDITSPQLPEAFDGYRIAFASDFHLKSKFKERQLRGTVKALQALAPDVLMLGGDYQEGCEYVGPLFDELAKATPPDGIYAVLGNNDYERCTQHIRETMLEYGIILLEDSTAFIHRGADSIIVKASPSHLQRIGHITPQHTHLCTDRHRCRNTTEQMVRLACIIGNIRFESWQRTCQLQPKSTSRSRQRTTAPPLHLTRPHNKGRLVRQPPLTIALDLREVSSLHHLVHPCRTIFILGHHNGDALLR